MDQSPAWVLPAIAVAFGLFVLALAKLSSWSFDRKHPHLSRASMRAAEKARLSQRVPPQ